MHEGSKFFDKDNLFELYRSSRHRSDTPNETLEKPIISELIGDVYNKRNLDLGCGDGYYGFEILNSGCFAYIGLESSFNMEQNAKKNLQGLNGEIVHTKIENWGFRAESFDLVISRLALHYVANLAGTFHHVNKTLKKDGRFVFSIVHPVITSSDKSREKSGVRYDWIVDDYFKSGSRRVRFMGEFVEQYHRTIEELFCSLQNAGFIIEQLRESRPRPEIFEDENLYTRRMRIPLFLFFSSLKI